MEDILLGLGVLMVLACIGVYLTNKFQQSMILAYILVGILIGPNIMMYLGWGITYNGLIRDDSVISVLLNFSLILMFFFVGLEFSITRLKETKKGAAVLAITHVSTNLFLGFALASVLGWPLYDSIFLAGVIAVSSAAIAIKTLTDLHKLNGHEVKFLLGSIIVEDFILIMMISLATMSAVYGSLDVWKAIRTSIGLVVMYAFFIVLGFLIVPIIVPRLNKWMEANESEDIFVLVTFAVIFLAGAFAALLGIPAAFGSFFMGMAFAETSFSRNVMRRMQGLKLGSTALFFMSFGMLISFRADVMSTVLPMILLVIPLVFLNEVFIVGTVGFLAGFRPRESMTIGSCLCGRGEDALLYASVGAGVRNRVTDQPVLAKSTYLLSFAGLYCFIMACLTPMIVKKIDSLAAFVTKKVPESISFGGSLVQATLIGPIMSVDAGITKAERNILIILTIFAMGLLATMLAPIPVVYIVGFNTGIIALLWLWVEAGNYLHPLITEDRFEPLHIRHLDMDAIHDYVHTMVFMPPAMMFVAVAVWSGVSLLGLPLWWLAIISVLICLGGMVQATRDVYGRTMGSWEVKPEARPRPRPRTDDEPSAASTATPLYLFRGQAPGAKAKADAAAAAKDGKAGSARFRPIPLENLMTADEEDKKSAAADDAVKAKADKADGVRSLLHIRKKAKEAGKGNGKEAGNEAEEDSIETVEMDEPPPRQARRFIAAPRPRQAPGRAARAMTLSMGRPAMTQRQPLTFMPGGNRMLGYGRGRPGMRPTARRGTRRAMPVARPMMNSGNYRRRY